MDNKYKNTNGNYALADDILEKINQNYIHKSKVMEKGEIRGKFVCFVPKNADHIRLYPLKGVSPKIDYNNVDAIIKKGSIKKEVGVEGIEKVIEDSKLYQGFQCKSYITRVGLKKRLAQAIKTYLEKG